MMDKKTLEITRNLVIHFEELLFHSLNPEFYFLNDNNVSLDSFSPFLPMPLKDRESKN
jgi:hypothetical protein